MRSPAQARILPGLITGIGFIGGGAILRSGSTVRGTATAASLWNVGVVGAAVGFGYYDLGLILALANFAVLAVITPLESQGGEEQAQGAATPSSAKQPDVKEASDA